MSECKSVTTPIETKLDHLYDQTSEQIDVPYQMLIGLYKRDPRQLASLIIKGEPVMQEEVLPDLPGVEIYYAGLFEETPPCTRLCVHDTKDAGEVFFPIKEEEVLDAMKGWSNSAPGPDGITTAQVKRYPASLLEALYNILVYRRFTPTEFRASRTVLLLKIGDLMELANWRPIAISSAVQRLFHRIFAKRLAMAVDLYLLQRGFMELDGTLANITLLDTSRPEESRVKGLM
ncbi:hypothetical protein Trydic_g19794 [Trypoxylus dichotomus]